MASFDDALAWLPQLLDGSLPVSGRVGTPPAAPFAVA